MVTPVVCPLPFAQGRSSCAEPVPPVCASSATVTRRRRRGSVRVALATALVPALAAAQVRQFEFDSPAAFTALSPQQVTTADVDGDGDLDVVGSAPFAFVTLQLLRNDGALGFTDVTTTQLPVVPSGVGCAHAFDADGDGDLDLFVGGVNAPSLLLTNDGSGSFAVAQTLAFAPSVFAAASADLDGDLDLDLVVTGSFLYGSVDQVLVNGGSGTFGAGPQLGYSLGSAIALFDVDGDGDPDLLLADSLPRLLRNDGNLSFVDVTATHVAVPQPTASGALAAGDLDGDGDVDVILRGAAPSPDIVVLNVAGVLTGVGVLPAAASTVSMSAADVDRDGDLDVVRGHALAGLSLALNDGSGAFTDAAARLPAATVVARDVHLADLDRDRDPDLVVANVFLGALQLLRNRHVDLVAGPAAIGQPWTVAVGSAPGYATRSHFGRLAIGLLALPQPVVLPVLGELWLDVGGPLVLVGGVIAPSDGEAQFTWSIPNAPPLVGVTLHVQGLVEQFPGPARLTAYRPITIQ